MGMLTQANFFLFSSSNACCFIRCSALQQARHVLSKKDPGFGSFLLSLSSFVWVRTSGSKRYTLCCARDCHLGVTIPCAETRSNEPPKEEGQQEEQHIMTKVLLIMEQSDTVDWQKSISASATHGANLEAEWH